MKAGPMFFVPTLSMSLSLNHAGVRKIPVSKRKLKNELIFMLVCRVLQFYKTLVNCLLKYIFKKNKIISLKRNIIFRYLYSLISQYPTKIECKVPQHMSVPENHSAMLEVITKSGYEFCSLLSFLGCLGTLGCNFISFTSCTASPAT